MLADCQEPGSVSEPYNLGNRVWATFTFFTFRRTASVKAATSLPRGVWAGHWQDRVAQFSTLYDTMRDASLTCAQQLT